MPELPEVETIRRQLEPLIVGKTISFVEVFNQNSFKARKKDLIGDKVVGVGRKGKVIILSLKRPGLAKQGQALYVHLKMSGQLRYRYFKISISSPLDNRHLRVAIKFSNGDCLEFHDQRKFGWITDDPTVLPRGIDALDPELSSNKLAEIVGSSSRPIKQILLDQSKIAG
ncbi:MAG: DNA-formamidopyrimidine glycosylase family protein, partial [Patescibacteria group bacterium]|nr:DNA-formamidopyrimidine glycosylase family protein [Patescibacteria group bacterium]